MDNAPVAGQIKRFVLRFSALKPGEAGKTVLLSLYLFLERYGPRNSARTWPNCTRPRPP